MRARALSGASWPGTTTDPVYVWVENRDICRRFGARHLKEKNKLHMAARNNFESKILCKCRYILV
jgi:hypothetical protein